MVDNTPDKARWHPRVQQRPSSKRLISTCSLSVGLMSHLTLLRPGWVLRSSGNRAALALDSCSLRAMMSKPRCLLLLAHVSQHCGWSSELPLLATLGVAAGSCNVPWYGHSKTTRKNNYVKLEGEPQECSRPTCTNRIWTDELRRQTRSTRSMTGSDTTRPLLLDTLCQNQPSKKLWGGAGRQFSYLFIYLFIAHVGLPGTPQYTLFVLWPNYCCVHVCVNETVLQMFRPMSVFCRLVSGPWTIPCVHVALPFWTGQVSSQGLCSQDMILDGY